MATDNLMNKITLYYSQMQKQKKKKLPTSFYPPHKKH